MKNLFLKNNQFLSKTVRFQVRGRQAVLAKRPERGLPGNLRAPVLQLHPVQIWEAGQVRHDAPAARKIDLRGEGSPGELRANMQDVLQGGVGAAQQPGEGGAREGGGWGGGRHRGRGRGGGVEVHRDRELP